MYCRFQLGMMGKADVWLTDQLVTTGSLFENSANNLDKCNYTIPPLDSHLWRVGTNVREYVQKDVYVHNLQSHYVEQLSNGLCG